MTTFYDNDAVIAYSGVGLAQTAIGVPLDQDDIDTAFTATSKRLRIAFSDKQFFDCSDQYFYDLKVLARWVEITIAFEATVQQLGQWWAFAEGLDSVAGTNPLTHTSNLTTSRSLPVTTLRWGHQGETGFLIPDCFVSQITTRARKGFDSTIQCEMVLIGSGNRVAAVGTDWPECYTGTVIAMTDSQGELLLNGVDYLAKASEITASLSNEVQIESLFGGGSIDITDALRAKRRNYNFTVQIEGIDGPTDTLATLALAGSGKGSVVANSEWRAGTASTNRWSFKVPSGLLRFTDQPQDSLPDNLGGKEVLNLRVIPKVSKPKSATEPCQSISIISTAEQATAFLLPPS